MKTITECEKEAKRVERVRQRVRQQANLLTEMHIEGIITVTLRTATREITFSNEDGPGNTAAEIHGATLRGKLQELKATVREIQALLVEKEPPIIPGA